MTWLAGWIDSSARYNAVSAVRTILESQVAQEEFGIRELGDATGAFGLAGGSEVQNRFASNGRISAVADTRFDNRSELAEQLGLSPREASRLSDASLLLLGWQRRREGILDDLVGDFAFAIWEHDRRRLILARDPSGQRPLFYSTSGPRFAFASMPGGLAWFSAGFDLDAFASALGDQLASEQCYFSGVRRLLPGHIAIFNEDHVTVRPYWQPSFDPVQLSDPEFVEAYRGHLDEAVRCRARGPAPILACQLSAGWDSNAVTATAAKIADVPIVAYTSAPARGFTGPLPRGRLADESALAALTAKQWGIDHEIVREAPLTREFLEQQALAYQEPARNLINAAWNARIQHLARARGARTVLNGLLGNMTLHFGGLPVLAQWLSAGRTRDWWWEARAAARRGEARWRGILFNSFQPWLPGSLWHLLRQRGPGIGVQTGWFLNPALRERLSRTDIDQPSGNPALDRARLIPRLDHGLLTKGALAASGIEESDPLSDRRLIEFALRLPPEQMLHGGQYKPLARRALADRVPAKVLDSPLRGAQSGDWPARFTQAEARSILESFAGEPAAREILDMTRIDQAIAHWPRSDQEILKGWDLYARMLPIALATGVFIKAFQPKLSRSTLSRSG